MSAELCNDCGSPLPNAAGPGLYCTECGAPVHASSGRRSAATGAPNPDRFKLSIELGNDDMRLPVHVAGALTDIARKLSEGVTTYGSIRDINGNLVGQWRFQ